MRTTSGGGGSSLGPQLCPRPLSDARDEDNEFTLFRAMLIGGTASVILWGICIVVVLILRSKG
jgi:hypothetical protein